MTPLSNLQNDWVTTERECETTTSYVNEFAEGFEECQGRSHDHNGCFLCCCAVATRDYQRMSIDRNNCSNREESQYLIDNDELELSQRFDSKPLNGTIDKTFADDFV